MKQVLAVFILISAFECGLKAQAPNPSAQGSDPQIVPTFRCLSLYWSPASGAPENSCTASYREIHTQTWKQAFPLWFDPRNHQYRGSIVSLRPGTEYEVKLHLSKPALESIQQAHTWKLDPPIAKTVSLPGGTSATPYVISEGGTADGYVLYTAPAGQKTLIDVGNQAPNCIEVNAPYVVIRGLDLAGAQQNGIYLGAAAHDVFIEGCDIRGWGRIKPDGWGADMDAGVFADSPAIYRIVIRNNAIHNPRSNSNDWTQARPGDGEKSVSHPVGPQAIVFKDPQGNNVICNNEVYSDEDHRFNDGIGGASNYSTAGFPGRDSDVYENIVRNDCDDAFEIEGGGCNVRVWSNFMDTTFTGVSSAGCSVGPLYIFRNVMGRTRSHSGAPDGPDNAGIFGKLGDKHGFGGGRRYYFHNTLLQPRPPGVSRSLGAGWAIADWGGLMTNTVSRNNIWQTVPNLEQVVSAFRGNHSTSPDGILDHKHSPTNDLDYDLLTASVLAYPGAEAHALHGAPVFVDGDPGKTLFFGLAPSSPGVDAGEILPNFNDDYLGKGPDLGAQETGAERLVFGIRSKPSIP